MRKKIKRKLIGFITGEKGSIGKLQGLALGITGIIASGLPAKMAQAFWSDWSGDMVGWVTNEPYLIPSDPSGTWPDWPTNWTGVWAGQWAGQWTGQWTGVWAGQWTGVWTGQWTGVWTGQWTGEWTGQWTGEWTSNWPSNWPSNAAPSVDEVKAQ